MDATITRQTIEENKQEALNQALDLIYKMVRQEELYLESIRFNGGYDKPREDAIHLANYQADRIAKFANGGYRYERIALAYLEDFINQHPYHGSLGREILAKYKYWFFEMI